MRGLTVVRGKKLFSVKTSMGNLRNFTLKRLSALLGKSTLLNFVLEKLSARRHRWEPFVDFPLMASY